MTTEKKGQEWLESALKTGDPAKKLDYCTQYLKANPQDRDAWEYKGRLLEKVGRESEAVDCYEKSATGRSAKQNLAYIHIGSNDSAAVSLFSEMLEANPTYVNAWLGKGEALNNLKRYQESIACVEKAVALNPGTLALVDAWIIKGMALEGLGKLDEAVDCYDKALEVDVANARALISKAAALYYLERYEEAVVCADKILQNYPAPDLMGPMMQFKKEAEAGIRQKSGAKGEKQETRDDRPKSCTKCGSALFKDANFCTKCGAKL